MIDVRAVDELITAAESGAEIDAAKYAALLMHPVSEIGRQAGLRPLTGARDSSAELIQNYLGDALRVIATLIATRRMWREHCSGFATSLSLSFRTRLPRCWSPRAAPQRSSASPVTATARRVESQHW